MARCAADLKRSADARSAQPATLSPSVAEWPGFQAALAGLGDAPSRRACLAYLATQCGASICEDATLVADDASLAELSAEIGKQVPAGSEPEGAPIARDALGWTLDATTLRYMSRLQSDNTLPPEFLSVLIRHTGQVGSNVGSVGELVQAARDREDFTARLSAENFIYLEDSSPAARVRALDWLTARGDAPSGYDPLAPPGQRRQSLQSAWEAMARKAAAAAASDTSNQASTPQQGGTP
jgi:hypothetical protein